MIDRYLTILDKTFKILLILCVIYLFVSNLYELGVLINYGIKKGFYSF
jgi:hypothetical protein